MEDEYQLDCVLLIDDDYVTNYLNKNLLSKMQICQNIKGTEDVEEALQFIEDCYLPNNDPQSLLIILDINMPVLNGFEFLDELNSRTKIPLHKIDVIILSSSILRVDKERAKNYPILDYINKPLTLEKLKTALDRKNNK